MGMYDGGELTIRVHKADRCALCESEREWKKEMGKGEWRKDGGVRVAAWAWLKWRKCPHGVAMVRAIAGSANRTPYGAEDQLSSEEARDFRMANDGEMTLPGEPW